MKNYIALLLLLLLFGKLKAQQPEMLFDTGYLYGTAPQFYGEYNNHMFFGFRVPTSQLSYLVASDGTAQGTDTIYTCEPCFIGNLHHFPGNENVYFTSINLNSGHVDILKSDGTRSGTTVFLESDSSFIYRLIKKGDRIFYLFTHPDNSSFLIYNKDGTTQGVDTIKSFTNLNITFSSPYIEENDKLFFIFTDFLGNDTITVFNDQTQELEIVWEGNPTYTSYSGSKNGKAFFWFDDELWVSDGSDTGTIQISTKDYDDVVMNLDQIPASNELFYLLDSMYYCTLFKTDGTAAGPQPIQQFGPLASGMDVFIVGDSYLIGFKNQYSTYSLWTSNGKVNGTHFIGNLPGNISAPFFIPGQEEYYFYCNRFAFPFYQSLWSTDLQNLSLIVDLKFTNGFFYNKKLIHNNLFVSGTQNDSSGYKGVLWKSDGTPGGTAKMFEYPYKNPEGLHRIKNLGEMYFFEQDSTNVIRLYKGNGNTLVVELIDSFPLYSNSSLYVKEHGERAYFNLRESPFGSVSIWTHDGSQGSSVKLIDSLYNVWSYHTWKDQVSTDLFVWVQDSGSHHMFYKMNDIQLDQPAAAHPFDDIKIYPNPGNELNILLPEGNRSEKYSYSIYNIQGKTMSTGILSMGNNNPDISNFTEGIYFIHLRTKDGSCTRKWIYTGGY